jgi:hypothetical protein
MCLPVSRLFSVSSLAYPNLLGTKGYVVVVVVIDIYIERDVCICVCDHLVYELNSLNFVCKILRFSLKFCLEHQVFAI